MNQEYIRLYFIYQLLKQSLNTVLLVLKPSSHHGIISVPNFNGCECKYIYLQLILILSVIHCILVL